MQSAENLKIPMPKRIGTVLVSRVQVRKGYKILDLGCGFGSFAVVLFELVGPEGYGAFHGQKMVLAKRPIEGKVVAVDLDAGRIRAAEDKNARANIE